MKGNRSLLLAALCVLGMFLGGCRSTWDFWKNNAKGVVQAQNYNLNRVHRSVDRHFLNYDWDNPYYGR